MPIDSFYCQLKGWEGSAFGVTEPEEGRKYQRYMRLSGCAGSSSILEIGFGNGGFAGWAIAEGLYWVGIERNDALVNRARLLGFRAYGSLASVPVPVGGFDYAIALDVIEHIPRDELVTFVRETMLSLKNGGSLILRYPNGDSPFGRQAQHSDLSHLSTIGSGIIAEIALASGAELTLLVGDQIPVLGFGPVRGVMRATLRIVRTAILGVLRILFFGGVRVPLDPLCLAVLRKQ